MKSNRIFGSALLIATTGLLLSSGCGGKKGASVNAAVEPPPTVGVAQIVQQTVPLYSEFVGQTKATQTVEIRARVQGTLDKVVFTEGAPVSKGQVLFQIQKSEYEAALLAAKAALSKAQADLFQAEQRTDVIEAESELAQVQTRLSLAQSDLDRYIPLAKENAVTQVDLDAARAKRDHAMAEVTSSKANLTNKTASVKYNIEKAKALVAAAKADVSQAELNLSYCTIYSPIAGIIGLQQVNAGNLVGKNEATLLTTISSSDPFFVDFNISEAFLLQLTRGGTPESRRGVAFQLVLSDNSVYEHEGRFSVVDRTVDPKTGTILVRATFPNAGGRLRPGQFARVRVAAEERVDAILVPQVAVQELQSAKYVLVVGSDNKVSQRTVKVGERYEESYIVTDGLQAGERVVIEGIQKVRPGMEVTPTGKAGA
jgi:membrane fusion protein, multidrug efflux system